MVSCAPRLPLAVSGTGVRCGRACWARVSAVPSPSLAGLSGCVFLRFCFFFFFLPGVPVPGLLVPLPPSSFFRGALLALVFFRGVCLHVSVSLFPVGCCSWLDVAGFGWVVPLWLFWGSCLRCLLGGGVWPPLVVLAGGLVAEGRFCAPPPSPLCCFLFGGGACLFLPLPSLGWRTHWPAFSVVFRAAVGGCVLFGRVPAPWPLLAGLGPGSAGWPAAPGDRLWLWVRGLGLFVSFPLCGAGFNLLGGPTPLLPGALWPRVWPAVLVCGVLVRRFPVCVVARCG